MQTSISMNISIERRLSIVQKAIDEIIKVCLNMKLFKHFHCSKEYRIYSIEINANKISSNIGEAILVIGIKPETSNSSRIRAVLIYELKRNTIHLRLLNTFYGKYIIKQNAFGLLLKFKKKVEKWL